MSINHLTQMPLGLAIQRGNIPNFSGIQKFGYNTAVGTVFETIWENGSLYSYPTSSTTAVFNPNLCTPLKLPTLPL